MKQGGPTSMRITNIVEVHFLAISGFGDNIKDVSRVATPPLLQVPYLFFKFQDKNRGEEEIQRAGGSRSLARRSNEEGI